MRWSIITNSKWVIWKVKCDGRRLLQNSPATTANTEKRRFNGSFTARPKISRRKRGVALLSPRREQRTATPTAQGFVRFLRTAWKTLISGLRKIKSRRIRGCEICADLAEYHGEKVHYHKKIRLTEISLITRSHGLRKAVILFFSYFLTG